MDKSMAAVKEARAQAVTQLLNSIVAEEELKDQGWRGMQLHTPPPGGARMEEQLAIAMHSGMRFSDERAERFMFQMERFFENGGFERKERENSEREQAEHDYEMQLAIEMSKNDC